MSYKTYDDMVSDLCNIATDEDATPFTMLLWLTVEPCQECFGGERRWETGEHCEDCHDTGIGLCGEDVSETHRELVAALETAKSYLVAEAAGQVAMVTLIPEVLAVIEAALAKAKEAAS